MIKYELISVIIPVYKVECYLSKCVESIINQTYKNIEIILVDDGSPDNCGRICDEYALKDNRIKVIHTKNGGVSSARNAGIDASTGSFITFVDSDDYISQNYIETLYKNLTETNSEISVVDHTEIFDGNEFSKDVSAGVITVFSQHDFIVQLLNKAIICSCWGKLYKRDLFDDIRFPLGRVNAEDAWVLYKLCFKSSRIVYDDTISYYYLIREGSAVQKNFDIEMYISNTEINDEIMNYCEKLYPDLLSLIKADRLSICFKMLYRIMCADNRVEFYEQEKEMICKIKKHSVGLLRDKSISKNLKIKIISFSINKYAYFFVQKLSDFIKQLKAGRKYVV